MPDEVGDPLMLQQQNADCNLRPYYPGGTMEVPNSINISTEAVNNNIKAFHNNIEAFNNNIESYNNSTEVFNNNIEAKSRN
ncbi:hypothetical protein CEXT_160301 [Caerostris extrusa]|uniref:Uncharacterized protein n=1 Tax=Caerostris extrusa TaxID=172846 RepID=A0AAV4T889_CAEEX|nr:hypothetical protein CEXT_160301 [Caerostris extrusa]